MLTGAVNIAVFATFRWCAGAFSTLIPDFKRICRDCRVREGGKSGTIAARNGKDVATDGTVGGKNGKDGNMGGKPHPLARNLCPGRGGQARWGTTRTTTEDTEETEETEATRRGREELAFLSQVYHRRGVDARGRESGCGGDGSPIGTST